MSGYKLTYFNITALGEPIRFLLSYAGVPFEDNRVSFDDWPALKSKTPLEQLPILEFDGKTLYQSNAIIRYIASKYNFFGTTEFEHFEVDAAIETITDLRQLLAKWSFKADPATKEANKAETLEKVAFFLKKFEATVKKNGGFFVGGKITAADLVFTGYSYFLTYLYGEEITNGYPSLKNLVAKVVAEPKIKAYLAKRPTTEF